MSGSVLVVVEHLKGEITEITCEMLGVGRKIADALGTKLQATLIGENVSSMSGRLGVADEVLILDRPGLGFPFVPEMAHAVKAILDQESPVLVLFGGTNLSMGLSTRLAALTRLPLVNFCTKMRVEGNTPVFTSQLFGGKILADTRPSGTCAIISVYPGSFPGDEGRSDRTPPTRPVDVAIPAPGVVFKQFIEPEAGDVDLTKQDILVSVGRGIQNADNIEMAKELAEALGGVVSASRPVVDQGWLPMTRQVGKSGMTVKPRLYLALGISGAPEHVEGMHGSRMIIAINTDPQAPIFNIARYGICADLFDVVPVLTEALKTKK